jgi:hypothetical protein
LMLPGFREVKAMRLMLQQGIWYGPLLRRFCKNFLITH